MVVKHVEAPAPFTLRRPILGIDFATSRGVTEILRSLLTSVSVRVFQSRLGAQLDVGAAVRRADEEEGGEEAEGGEAGADEEGGLEAFGEDDGVVGVADNRVGDGGEGGEAEGTADLLGGVDQAA